MTFEKVLHEVGEFGFFQKIIICGFIYVSSTLWGTGYWTQIFILLVPPHRCKSHCNDNSWTSLDPKILSGAQTDCSINVFLNDSSEITTSNNLSCPFGWVYDISDMYQTFPSQYNWVCNNSWKVYSVHTIYWIGSMIGFILIGIISDKFGRKLAFCGCILFMLAGDIGTFFSYDFATLSCCRFISAIGAGSCATCSFILAIEYIGPKYRVICVAILSLTNTFTAAVSPFIVRAVQDWHYILIIGWCISLVSFIAVCCIPESGSWLIAKGRIDDATQCIYIVAKLNGKKLSRDCIKEMLLKVREQDSSSKHKYEVPEDTKDTTECQKYRSTFLHDIFGLIRTPNMRKHTFLLLMLWMICSACYTGNSVEISNLPFPFRISYFIAGISELPALFVWLVILENIGRRWTNLVFFSLGGIFAIMIVFLNNTIAVMVFVSIIKLCIACTYDVTFTMSSEIFPTVIRGRGTTIMRVFGSLASALSPFIVSLSEEGKLLPYIVFGILCLIGGFLALFLPETTGQTLPHTLDDGESFGKGQSFFYCPYLARKSKVTK